MHSTQTVKSICRICPGLCGIEATVENNRLIKVRGDHDHPLSKGYACIKGLQAPEQINGSARVLHPLKRQPDGSFEEISYTQALDEIAEKLNNIIERDGPDAIAAYRGTAMFGATAGFPLLADWLTSIGSRSLFTTNTIDQVELLLAPMRMGMWAAGKTHLYDADVVMIVGTNPLVSLTTANFDNFNPAKSIRDAKARGTQFIVIDPRCTEMANKADLFLQPYPGEDPVLAAGLLRVILSNGWQDKDFCAEFVDQLDTLRELVEPFTPEVVTARAGVPGEDLIAAAKLFAQTRAGVCYTGTGPVMSYRGLLTKHLYECIDVICGHFLRPGDKVRNPGIISAEVPALAQVFPGQDPFEPNGRIRAARSIYGERCVGTLAEEILTPGEDQVKAFLSFGSNPAATIPNRKRIVEAFENIELLVSVDPYINDTGKLAHYILPPALHYERADFLSNYLVERFFVSVPFQQYAPVVVPPPAGSDVMDDCQIFWELAKRMNVQLMFNGVPLDMETAPSKDDLLAIAAKDGRISLEELKQYPNGKLFDVEQIVQPAMPGADAKFQLALDDMAEQLKELATEPTKPQFKWRDGKSYSHVMASRRMREVYNTWGPQISTLKKKRPYNPAYLHPDDLNAIGVTEGDGLWIESPHGKVAAIAGSDPKLKPGVLSIAHGWGRNPGEEQSVETDGTCVSSLIADDQWYDPISAKPRMSGIPVNIFKR